MIIIGEERMSTTCKVACVDTSALPVLNSDVQLHRCVQFAGMEYHKLEEDWDNQPQSVEDREAQARNIIARLRDEYLMPAHKGAEMLKESLGGALERLGADLYRDEHHFIYELLQNCDDNDYDSSAVPSAKLLLITPNGSSNHKQGDMLVCLNNEHGFSEKNVRALCRVNGSTKCSDPQADSSQEKIGRKGGRKGSAS
eukprot:gene3539-4461_t